jgi:hypothetical protein
MYGATWRTLSPAFGFGAGLLAADFEDFTDFADFADFFAGPFLDVFLAAIARVSSRRGC